MLTKENAFTLPFAILLCEAFFFNTKAITNPFQRLPGNFFPRDPARYPADHSFAILTQHLQADPAVFHEYIYHHAYELPFHTIQRDREIYTTADPAGPSES